MTTDPAPVANTPSAVSAAGASVTVRGVHHHYGNVTALNGVDLEVLPGEFLTLLGPSGSGKTTLLQAVAGMVRPTSGAVWIGDRDVTGQPPERRDIGFVFQNYALFPHLTVAQNVAFPLQVRRTPRPAARRQVAEALELVGLGALASRTPSQLSGGQQQRVALARAIVFHPKVLLLDEPLGALDRQWRQQLGVELRRLQRDLGITSIYVTHDQEEAFNLSNRVAIFNQASIVQLATPKELYERPTSMFCAEFVGDLNSFHGMLRHQAGGIGIVKSDEGLALRCDTQSLDVADRARLDCGIRPEHLRVRPAGDDAPGGFPARVDMAIFNGPFTRYDLRTATGRRVIAQTMSVEGSFAEGDDVTVTFDPAHLLCFPAATDDGPPSPTRQPRAIPQPTEPPNAGEPR
ncbi:MAG: ABC transporter ATP-binding protein [Ilumatobacteraceae bacterium]